MTRMTMRQALYRLTPSRCLDCSVCIKGAWAEMHCRYCTKP